LHIQSPNFQGLIPPRPPQKCPGAWTQTPISAWLASVPTAPVLRNDHCHSIRPPLYQTLTDSDEACPLAQRESGSDQVSLWRSLSTGWKILQRQNSAEWKDCFHKLDGRVDQQRSRRKSSAEWNAENDNYGDGNQSHYYVHPCRNAHTCIHHFSTSFNLTLELAILFLPSEDKIHSRALKTRS